MKILSAVQFCPRLARSHAEVMDNFRRLEPLVKECSALASELVVFPELCCTGYAFMSKEEAFEAAEPADGPTFQKMRKVAQYLSAYTAWGYLEHDPVTDMLHNSATLVTPDGIPISAVRKINLWGPDFLWATPGPASAPVVRTDIGLISLAICRDIRDKIPDNIPKPRLEQSAKSESLFEDQKVDVVAACANWGKGGYPATTWMDFAANNKCTLVVANRWGKEEGNKGLRLDFGQGGPCVIEKDWSVHTDGIKFGEDCVVTAAIGSDDHPVTSQPPGGED